MSGKTNLTPVLIAVMALMCLAAGTAMAAPVTQSITYQGKLTDAAGSPLTGTYSVTFRLYDASTGGTALSTDTHSVTAANGLFTTAIAVTDPAVVDGRALWLGIRVGTDAEMTPRQEIRPVPYALSLRPGAIIRGTGTTDILKIFKSDAGNAGINITMAGTGSTGIIANTTAGSSPGVAVRTIGTGSDGIVVLTNGQESEGVLAVTTGHSSPGVKAMSYGSESPGVIGESSRNAGVYGRGIDGGFFTTNSPGTSFSDMRPGVNVSTLNDYNPGAIIRTYGEHSPAILAEAFGDDTKGVSLYTAGRSSNGILVKTTGDWSNGALIETEGRSGSGIYIQTQGTSSDGVRAYTQGDTSNGFFAYTQGTNSDGVVVNTQGTNSEGISAHTSGEKSRAVFAFTEGASSPGIDVFTTGTYSEGVYVSTEGDFSYGLATSTKGANSDGINARANGANSRGVYAYSAQNYGVYGEGVSSAGVRGQSSTAAGVYGRSQNENGIYAVTDRADDKYGIYTPDYLYAKGTQVPAADVAEYMPVTEDVTPGTVLVIGPDGRLQPCTAAYDTRVAGIVSTEPGMTLATKEDGNVGEEIIAVAGRVPCRVDAGYGAIQPGDVLTTSPTTGLAMKAVKVNAGGVAIYEPGTVLGKAMGTLESGTGTIEVLVTLQ